MKKKDSEVSQRKKDHIELCLTDEVAFREKTNGFDRYDFKHYAVTEVNLDALKFKAKFLKKTVDYPFLISCMTGGASAAGNINAQLAESAAELNIPIGVGSQRQALENNEYHSTYKIIREKAPKVPVLGNIGAAQLVNFKSFDPVQRLADMVEADAMVVHVNPLQELIQRNGEPDFIGLLKKTSKLVKTLSVPVLFKEVGAGISKEAAKKLLEAGAAGIDVAGSGGTSWSGVEMLRNNSEDKDGIFWDWGLPTSYCLREVSGLKKKYKFVLIGSGGINNAVDMAKTFALGADIAGSARTVLIKLKENGAEGVVNMIVDWFEIVKKIMFLTGSSSIKELAKNKIIRKEELY